MKTLLILVLITPLLIGCQRLYYKHGDIEASHTEFATFQKIGPLKIKGADGTEVESQGIETDQVQGVKATAEGITKGVVEGLGMSAGKPPPLP